MELSAADLKEIETKLVRMRTRAMSADRADPRRTVIQPNLELLGPMACMLHVRRSTAHDAGPWYWLLEVVRAPVSDNIIALDEAADMASKIAALAGAKGEATIPDFASQSFFTFSFWPETGAPVLDLGAHLESIRNALHLYGTGLDLITARTEPAEIVSALYEGVSSAEFLLETMRELAKKYERRIPK